MLTFWSLSATAPRRKGEICSVSISSVSDLTLWVQYVVSSPASHLCAYILNILHMAPETISNLMVHLRCTPSPLIWAYRLECNIINRQICLLGYFVSFKVLSELNSTRKKMKYECKECRKVKGKWSFHNSTGTYISSMSYAWSNEK